MGSRRSVRLAVVGLVAGVIALAGCGGPPPEGAGPTRTIADAKGRQVAVPVEPARIVTLSEPTLEGALALGIKPVGVASARGQQGVAPYLAERVGDVPLVASTAEPDLAAIVAARPDLILVDYTVGSKKNLDELAGIAPTAYVSDAGADWRSAFTAFADVVNRSADAERVLAEHDAAVAGARTELAASSGQAASIVRWDGEGPRIVGSGGHADEVVRGVGLTRPAAQQEKVSNKTPVVSLEQLDKLDGDWMFFGTLGDGEASEAKLTDARAVPAFAQLRAEREGHVIAVDGSAWTSSGGPIAAQVVLDEVVAALRG